jgi:hypothetical protein
VRDNDHPDGNRCLKDDVSSIIAVNEHAPASEQPAWSSPLNPTVMESLLTVTIVGICTALTEPDPDGETYVAATGAISATIVTVIGSPRLSVGVTPQVCR